MTQVYKAYMVNLQTPDGLGLKDNNYQSYECSKLETSLDPAFISHHTNTFWGKSDVLINVIKMAPNY